MRTYLCIIIIVFYFSCNENCPIDLDFAKVYNNALSTVTIEYEKETDTPKPYNVEKAFYFLGAISGHFSSRDGTHFGMMYKSNEDYQLDIEYWKKWYNNNKCEFNIEKADSIFKTLNLSNDSFITWKEYLENYPPAGARLRPVSAILRAVPDVAK